jgi:hypothetical protein
MLSYLLVYITIIIIAVAYNEYVCRNFTCSTILLYIITSSVFGIIIAAVIGIITALIYT